MDNSSPQTSPDPVPSRGVPSMATMELIVAAIFLCIGVVICYDSSRLGYGWSSDGPKAGYFPFRLGLILIVCASVIIGQTLWRYRKLRGNFIEPEQVRPVMTVLIPTAIYVLGIEYLGIYVASSIFVALFMVFIGRFSWWKSLTVGVVMSLVAFWVFEKKFLVPLPKGPLETWLGY